ncbi:MAG: hypothetical protein RML40_11300, partial [Bacteroidota bacterium]|nr:hypothetical protein [Candidatus Kapabacteria bacterium]MDW8221101.1 hypothetical protein [Bacteroidota bacterium]
MQQLAPSLNIIIIPFITMSHRRLSLTGTVQMLLLQRCRHLDATAVYGTFTIFVSLCTILLVGCTKKPESQVEHKVSVEHHSTVSNTRIRSTDIER